MIEVLSALGGHEIAQQPANVTWDAMINFTGGDPENNARDAAAGYLQIDVTNSSLTLNQVRVHYDPNDQDPDPATWDPLDTFTITAATDATAPTARLVTPFDSTATGA